MKRPTAYPHASAYRDFRGRTRWRYRRPRFQRELGTAHGTDQFKARYAEAEAEYLGDKERGAGMARTRPGSLSDLIASAYRSPWWRGLDAATRRAYGGHIEALRAAHGDKLVANLRRKHVMAILAAKADTPSAANNLRKRLAQLLDHAVDLEWIAANPARTVRPYRIEGGGFHSWDEAEIARFFEAHPAGTMAHRAVTLMLYTGAARTDAVRLGWHSIRQTPKGPRLEYGRRKTRRQADPIPVSIPLHPDLAAVLDDCDRGAFTFLQTAEGKGRSPAGLGNAMRDWCDAAGLPECSAHGLRKACARRLAEAGASAHQIMAVTGHKTLGEVERYTRAALREGMADTAMAKMIARPNREQTVVNIGHMFATKSRNTLKPRVK